MNVLFLGAASMACAAVLTLAVVTFKRPECFPAGAEAGALGG
jgi:hypothetical protein